MDANTLSTSSIPGASRVLQIAGAVGSVLALAILGASILLRLTTAVGEDGVLASTLSPAVEGAIRLVHRLSASGVGLLALLATLLCWRRPAVAVAIRPTAGIVAATVVLALIGPLTPGYRYAAVTVANVVGGTVLLASFWWLRESLATATLRIPPGHPMLRTTFGVLFLHVGLGAAASALEMRAIHWVAFLHVGTAMLTSLLVGAILWDRRAYKPLAQWVRTLAAVLVAQVVLGLLLLWIGGRPPPALGLVHAMLSPLLAVGLVSIAQRDAMERLDASSKELR